MPDIEDIFTADGPLSDYIKGFAERPQQQRLALLVKQAISAGSSLVCEAGAGVGKTFAYLAPALLANKKIIISTATKHLQEQLYYKDLPVIKKALGVRPKIVLLKGRANYLCLNHLENNSLQGDAFDKEELSAINLIKQWSTRTNSGDLAELTDLPEDSAVFPKVVSNKDDCLGKNCMFYRDCFLFKARYKANKANIVIVNHHLLLADLALRSSTSDGLLPGVDTIIFDEAHQLPELASISFSQMLSSYQFTGLFNDIKKACAKESDSMRAMLGEMQKCQACIQKLYSCFGGLEGRVEWVSVFVLQAVEETMQNCLQHLQKLSGQLQTLAECSNLMDNCWQRSVSMTEVLSDFTKTGSNELIQWLETKGAGFILHQTPIDVSSIFRERLQRCECNGIYISATLSVAEDFSYFTDQLGLTEVDVYRLGSPFNYEQQALLYLPQNMPFPRDPDYRRAFTDVVLSMIELSRGRIFLLFTSHQALQETYQLLSSEVDYPLLKQGDRPRTELLEIFRRSGEAVLLGTSSFWEGVDVKGDALSCVVIDKLPFEPPDDPVFKARSIRIKENGQNPFMLHQLPRAVLSLKQGAGRLIRDIHDYGVLVICDPRLLNKAYGKFFLESLPSYRVSEDFSDVVLFFSRINEK